MNVLEMFLGTSGGLDAVINIAVYAVIVLLFIVGIIRCILPISHTRSTIRRAIRSIKQGATGKRSWQEDKFLGKGCLYPHWSEYLNNLFFADGVTTTPPMSKTISMKIPPSTARAASPLPRPSRG